MSATIRLNLDLILPHVDASDQCVARISEQLAHQKGIAQAHIVEDLGGPRLCLHYDPNIMTLTQVQRLAYSYGAELSTRYRHEQIPFGGLDAADAADSVARIVAQLPGVLHAQANYAAGLMMVAYDTQAIQRATIEATLRQQGAQTAVVPFPGVAPAPHAEHGHGHDHGSAPAFLPHWMQEQWTLLLVALAGIFLLIGWVGETFLGLPANIALVLYLLAFVAGGYDVATHALPGLFRGQFDTDVLMLAAAAGAALLGDWVEGAFLLFLFSLGHAGEHYALDRARNAVSALGDLMPQTAHIRRGDTIMETAVDALQLGDIAVVRPGDRFPVDGAVVSGTSTVDQSPITGESVPVTKRERDEVFAGTINQTGALDVRVTKLAQDTTLSRVMRLVAEAQSQTSPTQQFTQRFTRYFVPAVLIMTVLVAVVPPLAGWMSWSQSFYRAMLLLVAASPCALALGTPAAVLAGIAQAARGGVLIKGGVYLEHLGRLNAIAFDKTGTLTVGDFRVTDVLPLGDTLPNELLRVAAAVEQQSNHPLALAIVRAAHAQQLALPVAAGLENIAGRGVKGRVEDQPVLIGALKLFEDTPGHARDPQIVQLLAQLEARGRSTMAVSKNGQFLGVIGLADAPRDDIRPTLQRLQALGVRHLVMLTGDNNDVAQRIAQQVGVTDVRAELLPEDKLAAIMELQRTYGAVAMVGDGVNDAPALATATVGIAMGGAGTAVALETADVALMGDDLRKLPFAVGLSRASRAVIIQNLAIALGVIGLLLVATFVGVLSLPVAVVLHEGSTIVVVLNALRLLWYRDTATSR